MKFVPQTFSIALIDFLSIMLPGLAVTYSVEHRMDQILRRVGLGDGLASAEYWPAFFIASYLAGHLVFMVGSRLDEVVFDRLRKATPWQQTQRHAVGKMPSLLVTRVFARLLFGKNPDIALTQVIELRKRDIPDNHGQVVVDACQWSKARLTLGHPAALAAVQRIEADSKFFRSFSVVIFFLIALLVSRAVRGWADLPALGFLLVLLCLSLWRYMERRFKAAQQACWFLLTLESMPRPEEVAKN
ncbi:MAG: hypothetical protein ACREIA_24915 [Opitutaceae bacterium]